MHRDDKGGVRLPRISRPLSYEEFAEALAIRLRVFVDEQKVPLEEERDDLDDTAQHFGCFISDQMVATARVLEEGKTSRIGRMAVLPEYRGRGLGRALMETMIKFCVERGCTEIQLSAQTHAIEFYAKCGFHAYGGEYMDAGIAHRSMVKKLVQDADGLENFTKG